MPDNVHALRNRLIAKRSELTDGCKGCKAGEIAAEMAASGLDRRFSRTFFGPVPSCWTNGWRSVSRLGSDVSLALILEDDALDPETVRMVMPTPMMPRMLELPRPSYLKNAPNTINVPIT